jgi:hypothetical protein
MRIPLKQANSTDTIPPKLFTVANIVIPKGHPDYYLVTFYQSARFYKLFRINKNCKKALALLKGSRKTSKPVQVFLTEELGDIIDDVGKK